MCPDLRGCLHCENVRKIGVAVPALRVQLASEVALLTLLVPFVDLVSGISQVSIPRELSRGEREDCKRDKSELLSSLRSESTVVEGGIRALRGGLPGR